MKTRNRSLVFLVGLCLSGAGLHVALTAQDLKQPRRECSFELSYHVKVGAGTSLVALTALVPQDLDHRQRVKSLTFTPQPARIFTRNGEKYASWEVKPTGDFTIKIRAKMVLERYDLRTAQARARKKPDSRPKPPKDLQDYLAAEKFIECEHKSIRGTAAEIIRKAMGTADKAGDKTKDRTNHKAKSGGGSGAGSSAGSGRPDADGGDLRVVKAVHAWVLGAMKTAGYNPREVGAVGALEAKTGDCTEYSDLFVALCRAEGVPARVIEGYTSSWVNVPQHNWTEVWLRDYGWVSFDPFRGEWLGGSVDNLKNIYIQLSHTRNNQTLRGWHFYYYEFRGSRVRVSSEFKLVK